MPEQISIRKKVILSVVLLSLLILASIVFTFFYLTYGSIKRFEIENTGVNVDRVVREISELKSGLSSQCNDWAAWDDTYEFIREKNEEYIEANLNEQTLGNLKINVAVYLNKESGIIQANFIDPYSKKSASFPDDLLSMIMKEKKITRFRNIDDHLETFFLYSGKPVLLASRPVRKSDYSGPSGGTLIFGKIFTEDDIKEMGKKIRLNLSVLKGVPEGLGDMMEIGALGGDSSYMAFASFADRKKINAFLVEKDLSGKDSFTFSVSMVRDFANKTLSDAIVYLIVLAFGALVMIVFVILFMDRSVLSPLSRLGRSARRIADEGSFSLRIEAENGREFGLLAHTLNDMLDSLEKFHARHEKDRESLVESESYLSRLLDSIDCGIIAAEQRGGRILNVNKAGSDMSGFSREELIGRRYGEIIVDIVDGVPVNGGECIGLTTCEGMLVRKNAGNLPVLKSTVPLNRKGRDSIIITFVDISILKTTENVLKENERKYREFFEQDLTGDFLSDVNGQVIDCNMAFARIFGFDSIDAVKRVNSNEFYFIPEERKQLLDSLKKERFLNGLKWTMKKSNGEPIYLVGNVLGCFDENDNLTHLRGYLFDDTDRIMLEKALRQAYKMEAIGTLAGGIAHDFNNILSAVLGHAELLLITSQNDRTLSGRLEKIIDSTKRAKDLVKQILTFSSRKDTEHSSVEMSLMVKEALHIFKSSVPSKIQIRTNLESLSSVKADPNQIHQIVINICINALDAMKERQAGLLEVSVDDVYLEPENEIMVRYGDYVRLTISDTGHGMSSDVADRIFDPFFTTRQKQGNTGMGLSVVHGIVKSLEGAIRVDSEPGEGSCFEIYIPKSEEVEADPDLFEDESEIIDLYKNYSSDGNALAMEVASEPCQPEELEQKEIRRMRVLVVEDEAIILEMLSEMIKNMGFIPEPKLDPLEALDFFKSNPGAIDIVMTDLSMPEMNGDRLAEEIFAISPGTPVIICSGFSGRRYEEDESLKGLRVFLKKPIVSAALLKTLNELQSFLENGSSPQDQDQNQNF